MLRINKEWFIDREGRKVLLRGVNLGASSKLPNKLHQTTDFTDHEKVSFVGRPFPLSEASEHFKRLKHWGFNCLRFLITWEAIEHEGPQKYDKEYLDYIEEVLKIASENKFYTFIDPHQDVWSRMSGGDGAPGWTFEKVGLDFSKFDETGAAYVMEYKYNPNEPSSYLPLHWLGNSYKFANGTMWTLFFGGKDFAPSCKIEGVNAQEYLQTRYLDAIKQVVFRVKDDPYIIGFDTLNEPNLGWIELKVDGSNLTGLYKLLGHLFSPFEAMITSSGYTRLIPFYDIKGLKLKETHRSVINKSQTSCWLEGSEDIWKKEGVWGLDECGNPIILNNDYFIERDGKQVNFFRDYLAPFISRFSEMLRNVKEEAFIFFEGPVEKLLKGESFEMMLPDNIINAGHWYDLVSINPKILGIKENYDIISGKVIYGTKKVQEMFKRDLKMIKGTSQMIDRGIPTLIGEFGLPFNQNKLITSLKHMIRKKNSWRDHIKALNMYYNAMDHNLLHSVLWNYTADNDQWNLEDFSIFNNDQHLNINDLNNGGRAIQGFSRPYFLRCAGKPLIMKFNLNTGSFYFKYEAEIAIRAPTIIHIPEIQYPNGYNIELTNATIFDQENKRLLHIMNEQNGICSVLITRKNVSK